MTESRSPRTEADPVLDAAADVRKSHQPNEWDSCVACRAIWPCDAELLAELVMTRAALAEAAAPRSGEGLRAAAAKFATAFDDLLVEETAEAWQRAQDHRAVLAARLRENTNAE